jgi:hypothetical protein
MAIPRRSVLFGAAAAAAAAAPGSRAAHAVPAALASPELDARIFPVGVGDLMLAVGAYSGGLVDGGVIRRATSIQIPWNYTQTVTPTDPAIGTAVLVDWQATLTDNAPWQGPIAQPGWFGPRAVFHLDGDVRYGRDMSIVNITPIAFGNQLKVSNADGANRTITPGWGFMNAPWFQAKDNRVLTLNHNDTATGMGGFVDNQLYLVDENAPNGRIDGVANGYEALSFVSRNFVLPNVHLTGVVGFDMADINVPLQGSGEPGPPAGRVNQTIGVRVQHLSKGGTFGIGVQNGSRTVRPPQTATVPNAGTAIRTDASVVVVQNSSSGPLTLTSVPTLPAGRDGQIVTLVNGGTHAVTLQGTDTLAGSSVRSGHTLLSGDVLDLIFQQGVWRARSSSTAWNQVRSLPGVSAFAMPMPRPGVTTYQATHGSGGVTGIDVMTPTGETAPAANLRLFKAGETAPRTVVALGGLGFSDGTNAADGTYLVRSAAGVLTVGSFTGTLHTVRAGTFHGGQRRDVQAATATAYTVTATDGARTVTRNSASASTMTWPTDAGAAALAIGTEIPVCNLGAGAVTHQGASGATVITAGPQSRGMRWVGVKVAANTWCVG